MAEHAQRMGKVTLTVAGAIVDAAGADALRAAVVAALASERQRLGLSADPEVVVAIPDTPRTFELDVNGAAVPYPRALLSRLCDALAPGYGVDAPGGPLGERLEAAGSGAAARLATELAAEFTLALIRGQPELLFDDAAARAYTAALGADIDHERWAVALRALLALNGTLGPRQAVCDAVAGAESMGLTGRDVVESAFATLRKAGVDVRLAPADFERLAAPPRLSDAEGAWKDAYDRLRQRFFEVHGLLVPEIRLGSDESVGTGRMIVCVAGVPGLPAALASDGERLSPMIEHVAEELSRQRQRLLSVDDFAHLLQLLMTRAPGAVRLALATFAFGDLLSVARELLADRLSLRDLRGVLDRLLEYGPARGQLGSLASAGAQPETNGAGSHAVPAEAYADFVRRRLEDVFVARFARGNRARVVSVDPDLEARLAEGGPPLGEHERAAIRDVAIPAPGADEPPAVVVTRPAARRALRDVLAVERTDLQVIADAELPSRIERIEVARLGPARSG